MAPFGTVLITDMFLHLQFSFRFLASKLGFERVIDNIDDGGRRGSTLLVRVKDVVLRLYGRMARVSAV
jgi:hypothetical protein